MVFDGEKISGQKLAIDIDTELNKKLVVNLKPRFDGNEAYEFKENVWNKLFGHSKSDKNNIKFKVFKRFFYNWTQYKKKGLLDNFDFVIDESYFENSDVYERYKEKNKNYKNIFEDDRDNGLIFKEEYVVDFKKEFESFYSNFMKRDNLSDDRLDDNEDFEEGDKMNGFFTVEEFRDIYGENYFTKNVNGKEIIEDGYIPRQKNTPDDITSLVLKNSPKAPKIHLNPLIEQQNFNKDSSNKVMKLRVNIKNKLSLLSNARIVGNYIYTCPECGEQIFMKNWEMSKPTISHKNCPNKITPSGRRGNVSISPKSYVNGKTLSIFLYEVYIYDLNGDLNKKPHYFYSFRDNLDKGEYMVDVVNINGRLTKPEDKDNKTLIYGVRRANPKEIKDLITPENGKLLAEIYGVPQHKLLDVLAGVINYYDKEKFIYINPRKGGQLQIELAFSCLAKNFFKNRLFPISVIGDTSISKTYTAKLISQLFDKDAKFTSGKKSQTYAGIYGGVNTDVMVGDKKVKMFQEGVASAGMVVFDEAPHFFDLEKEFNDDLKSLHNDWLEMFKVGGQKIRQTFTPLLFSNFSNYHKGNVSINYKDRSYEGEIKQYYWKLIRNLNEFEFHELNKNVADKYIAHKNLYLPIQCYENEYLRKTISLVRNLKESRDVCWWTGGSIPAQNRFLFDCVVKKNLQNHEEPFKDQESETEDDVYDLATDDFNKTVKDYLGIEKPINIQKIKENPKEITKQLSVLRRNIVGYLRDNDDIKLHFSNGRRVDEKVAKMIVEFFMILQLVNDIESISLDEETKILGINILMKNKRGIDEQEYNFLKHTYKPNAEIITNEEYLGVDLLHKIEEEDENKRIEEKIIEIEKKHSLMNEAINSNEVCGKGLNFGGIDFGTDN